MSVLAAIEGASRTLRVKMFVFSDPVLLKTVIAAKRRGVNVRVMLNPARRNGEDDNEATRRALARAAVQMKDANPAFDLTHEKSMVVDDATAFVTSFNWTTRNLTETRDYGIVTRNSHEVAEITKCFEDDWHGRPFDPHENSRLIWCPGPGRDRICRFIDEARHRLFVQNERFQDMAIIERLVRASQRGVKIDVMAGPPHTLKRHKLVEGVGGLRIMDDVGIKIHRLNDVSLHGKILLADGLSAIVGSINFAAGSFDGRRELAIEVRDVEIVERLHKVVRHDWEHSRPLDLSDEGLLADLEDRIKGSAEILGLDVKRG
jgi:phosphatidylserine/phosphatidylglycerophosphate/cardiolipin synthase-like enzyme